MNLEQTIREYLPGIIHMSLATSYDAKPWVCEVHFAYGENLNLYFRSLTSRRHSQEIAANPHVAGNIIKHHAAGEYPLGVYFEGTAALLEAGDEQRTVARLMKERLQITSDILTDAQQNNGHKFYKITVKNWYVFGKLDDQGGRKHRLVWNGAKDDAPILKKVDAVLVKVPSIQEGLDFYREQLGMQTVWKKEDMAAVRLGESELVLTTKLNPETDFLVESVEHAVKVFESAGGKVVIPPEAIPVGMIAVVEDPFGNRLTLVDLSQGVYETDDKGTVTGVTKEKS